VACKQLTEGGPLPLLAARDHLFRVEHSVEANSTAGQVPGQKTIDSSGVHYAISMPPPVRAFTDR
jgi:hypothetical protein